MIIRSGWGLKTSPMVSFGLESAREGRLILFTHLLRLSGQSERERPWVLYEVEAQEMECEEANGASVLYDEEGP